MVGNSCPLHPAVICEAGIGTRRPRLETRRPHETSKSALVTGDDILGVAPYNAQVSRDRDLFEGS